MGKYYELPKLAYDYKDLAPQMSEEQLRIHHTKHHQAYVNGANAILKKFDETRKGNADFDVKATLKELSFQIGGHLMHSLFWGNLAPAGKGAAKPGGKLGGEIDKEFGSFDRFKKEFTAAATSVEGSGWGALTYCLQTERPIIMQVEKHNVNVYPMFRILMVVDVFEHAYYIDYKNDRGKFVENFWSIVNWEAVNTRLEDLLSE
jgi:Fe-Mn family superoxide dismutase